MASSSTTSASSETLIPGLSDDISTQILLSLPLPHQLRLRPTCRRWSRLLSPPTSFPLRRALRLPSIPLLCIFPSDPSIIPPFLFDPFSLCWRTLPHLPCSPFFYNLTHFNPVYLSPFLYLIGGSLFDTRSYPLGQPSPSGAVYRLDLSTLGNPHSLNWERIEDMNSPRGSFACAITGNDEIVVAGGGSRHSVFPSHGSRISSVERYDVTSGKWTNLERLPSYRAGCAGFIRIGAQEDEFWVMGGYGDYTTLSGVVPADVYYKDAVVLGLKSGMWKEVGDMWLEGERVRMGPLAVAEGSDGKADAVFMLDNNEVFRYDFACNAWLKETSLKKKIADNESCGFAAMNGDLFVLTSVLKSDGSDFRRPYKRRPTLEVQVYSTYKKKWKLFIAHPPMYQPIDFKSTILCTIQI
ncbi:Kelch repeat containing F-box protein family-like [Rhynchospora pubera]|uniref:Kelch repeat containing F-box protein family-like n=1 Tax=Rhynchospora pubera TaxID=906938 RepID=A0AAV8CDK6_9POAL|nr:Kelch repeat containing F-box protein family-like [Rhynchospora pubera]